MSLDLSSIQSSPSSISDATRRAQQKAAGVVHESGEEASPNMPQLQAMIHDMEKISETFNRRLSFSVNEKLGQVVVKVIDNDTDKVVREIPPIELQHVYERIREVIGLLFDKKA